MSARKFQLPRRVYDEKHRELGEHARAVQEVFDRTPMFEHKTVEQIYAEPMTLGLSAEPYAIECVRIVNLLQQDLPVIACNGMVHYTWLPARGGAVIDNIGGMSVAANGGTKYRFYYRITHRMTGDA